MHPRFKSVPDVSYHVNILWLLVEFYHKRVREVGGVITDYKAAQWVTAVQVCGDMLDHLQVFFWGATKPGVFHGCQVFTQRGPKRNKKKHAGDETKKKRTFLTYLCFGRIVLVGVVVLPGLERNYVLIGVRFSHVWSRVN